MHIGDLAREACAGIDAGGGKSVLFNTITVSDGISMGTPGMRYSLVSREIIADSIEAVAGAAGFDGFVAIGGCDKNIPGCAMAMARLNRPAVFVYGGTIRPGAQRRDIVSVFEAVGAHAAGTLSDAGLLEIERTAIPGPGSCAGMYTANTMASAIEALGLSLPGSSAQEAVGEDKRSDCRRAGEAVVRLVREGLKPREILTRRSFENAITVVIALGGSTNAVLHLLAIAHEAGARVRGRGARHPGDSRRPGTRRRRGGDPPGGATRRAGHARDAQPHERHHGKRPGSAGGSDHRRALLRRQSRLCCWTHLPRGGGRRADRAAAQRGPHQHRCRRTRDPRAPGGRGAAAPARGLAAGEAVRARRRARQVRAARPQRLARSGD